LCLAGASLCALSRCLDVTSLALALTMTIALHRAERRSAVARPCSEQAERRPPQRWAGAGLAGEMLMARERALHTPRRRRSGADVPRRRARSQGCRCMRCWAGLADESAPRGMPARELA
jgi:hypothetical protein